MTLYDLHISEESHKWVFGGETSDEDNYYQKWVCPCGAMKIIKTKIIKDESGTYKPDKE